MMCESIVEWVRLGEVGARSGSGAGGVGAQEGAPLWRRVRIDDPSLLVDHHMMVIHQQRVMRLAGSWVPPSE